MRTLNIQKPFLIAVAVAFFAAQAQAQTICSGSGIYQSCVNKSGNAYNRNGAATQANAHNASTGKQSYQNAQKTGSATYNHNRANFGTQLNTGKSVNGSQNYNGVNQNLQNSQK